MSDRSGSMNRWRANRICSCPVCLPCSNVMHSTGAFIWRVRSHAYTTLKHTTWTRVAAHPAAERRGRWRRRNLALHAAPARPRRPHHPQHARGHTGGPPGSSRASRCPSPWPQQYRQDPAHDGGAPQPARGDRGGGVQGAPQVRSTLCGRCGWCGWCWLCGRWGVRAGAVNVRVFAGSQCERQECVAAVM